MEEQIIYRITLEGFGTVPKERVDIYGREIAYIYGNPIERAQLESPAKTERFSPRDLLWKKRWRGPAGLTVTDLVRWDPGPLVGPLEGIGRLDPKAIPGVFESLAKLHSESFGQLRSFCDRWHVGLDVLGAMTLFHLMSFRKTAKGILEEHARLNRYGARANSASSNGQPSVASSEFNPLDYPAPEWPTLAIAATSGVIATPPRRSTRVWDSRFFFDFLQLCRWELFHLLTRAISVRRCRICHECTLLELGRVLDCWWCRQLSGTAKQRSRRAREGGT